jgi:hypothetical protein
MGLTTMPTLAPMVVLLPVAVMDNVHPKMTYYGVYEGQNGSGTRSLSGVSAIQAKDRF